MQSATQAPYPTRERSQHHEKRRGREGREAGIFWWLSACQLCRGRFIRLVAVASVFLFLGSFWVLSHGSKNNHTPYQETAESELTSGYYPYNISSFPPPEGADDAVLIFKTGSQVLWQRLPVHLLTTTTRTPNFLIFSDLSERIGNTIVHDCLKDIGPAMREHEQFDLYREVVKVKPLPELDAIPSSRPYNIEIQQMKSLPSGWDLDKYKNIPILYQSFRLFPDKKWYIFVDGDSFLFLGNMLRHLNANYNPQTPLYIGSETGMGEDVFAHGGSGYVISHAAAKLAVVDHPELEHAFEEYAISKCCGDHVLSRLLDKLGVGISRERGRIDGEPWYGIRLTHDVWCKEILTFHHLTAGDVQELWEYERHMEKFLKENKRNNGMILYSDIYHRFMRPFLTSLESQWDNLSEDKVFAVPEFPGGFSDEMPPTEADLPNIEDEAIRNKWEDYLNLSETEKAAIHNREKCQQACNDDSRCFQYKWKAGKCALNYNIRFGSRDSSSPESAWWSGWDLDRIESVRQTLHCEQDLGGDFPAEEKRKAIRLGR